jgi:hypothetical protein
VAVAAGYSIYRSKTKATASIQKNSTLPV